MTKSEKIGPVGVVIRCLTFSFENFSLTFSAGRMTIDLTGGTLSANSRFFRALYQVKTRRRRDRKKGVGSEAFLLQATKSQLPLVMSPTRGDPMRRLSRPTFLCLLVTILLGALLTGVHSASGRQELEGEVIDVTGRAWVQRGGEGDEIGLSSGDLLYAEDVLRTGADSTLEVRTPDGSLLRVRQNSSLRMNDRRLTEGAGSSVSLFLGRLWCKVSKLLRGRSFHVETPTIVAGVRGTRYEVASYDDGTALVAVEEGNVELETEDRTVEVAQGQAVETEYDAPPGAPMHFDRSAEFWTRWRQRRLDRIPQVLPRMTERMQFRLGKGLELSRTLVARISQETDQMRFMMEKAVELKSQRRRRALRSLIMTIRNKWRNILRTLKRLERVHNRLAAAPLLVKRVHHLAERFREPLGADYPQVLQRIRDLRKQGAEARRTNLQNRKVIRENLRQIRELRKRLIEIGGATP
jgi:hypothetical protein